MEMQHSIRIVPAQSSVHSDNFKFMNRRALDVIQVHATNCPILEFQPDLSNILHIHFKWGNVSVERPQGFDFANDEAQIIQRMRKRDNNAAAQICTRGVALAIILPRMPLRKILTPLRMDS